MAKKVPPPVPEPEDPTAWILENGFAEFVLMHTNEIVSLLCCIVPQRMNMDKIFVQGMICIEFSIQFVLLYF